MSTATLHELVLRQARANPDAPAVISKTHVVSFAELVHGADRITHHLAARSLQPGSLVAVSIKRSPQLAMCLLGILQAGHAYLPLDRSQPRDRAMRILSEACVPLVIADQQGYQQLAADHRDLIIAEAVLATPAKGADPPDRGQVPADALAYVIYTSGSTGSPKGVEITHAAVVNTILSINSICSIQPHDRFFNVSPPAFDLSVYDLFGAWIAGSAVVIGDDESFRAEPFEWARWMGKAGVTVWNSVPAILEMLLEAVEHGGSATPAHCLDKLRVALLSGDRISVQLVRRLVALVPHVRVLAMGGATEASIWSVHGWAESLPADSAFVPYGRSLPNQTLTVLDAEMNEVPVGSAGQLYIGGAGVARGYRNRPDLTAAAFVADPLSPGAVRYATGDRVRRLQDGNTEFLGRGDEQVKVRGFRIEIAEVENALAAIQGVAQAAVSCIQTGTDSRLCAYVVLQHGLRNLEVREIRASLADVLPPYMIPETFCFLERMPLTANGKLDRKKLSSGAGAAQLQGEPTPQAPTPGSTATESAVNSVWREVLSLDQIRPDEHFLDLGGNSVMASRIASRLSLAFRTEITVRDLFENATIAALSGLLTERVRPASATAAC